MSFDWSKFLTTGLPVPPGGGIPVRKDLRDLTDKERFLYLEGLKKFQNAPKADPLSYYQIAGIHGLPYDTWPKGNTDIPGRAQSDPTGFYGFCTHSSILFLTWHRPYLALFESTLHSHVVDIACAIDSKHPAKQEYMKLADDFRLPYWDWARKDVQIVPEEAIDPNYHVNGPPSSASVPAPERLYYNGLFAYEFPDGTPDEIRKTDSHKKPYETTVRYPDPDRPWENILGRMKMFYETPTGLPERPELWESRLPIPLPSPLPPPLYLERNLTERTAYLLLAYKTFTAMSNNRFRGHEGSSVTTDAANWGSVEDIHNAIHNLIGSTGGPNIKGKTNYGGHMTDVPVSAFDPIFWLRKCPQVHEVSADFIKITLTLIDFLGSGKLCMRNPDSFVVKRQTGWENFVTKKNEDEDIDSKLYPFRPDVNSWYDSKMVKRVEPFGYSYEEIKGLKYPTSAADKAALIKKIESIYYPLPTAIQQSMQEIDTAGQDFLSQAYVVQEIEKKELPATVAQLEAVVKRLPTPEDLLKTSLRPKKPLLRKLAAERKYLEWITNIKAEKHALGGTYSVHIFLGQLDEENVALWPAAPSHVGTFAPLGQSTTTGCGKCQEDQRDHTQVTSQIKLTIALVERYLAGIIPDLTVESVVPYLTKNLHWRVAKADGNVLENKSDVDGLAVFVVSNEYHPGGRYSAPYLCTRCRNLSCDHHQQTRER